MKLFDNRIYEHKVTKALISYEDYIELSDYEKKDFKPYTFDNLDLDEEDEDLEDDFDFDDDETHDIWNDIYMKYIRESSGLHTVDEFFNWLKDNYEPPYNK